MKIDVHNHCIPEKFIDALRKNPDSYSASIVVESNGQEAIVQPVGIKNTIRRLNFDMDLRIKDMDEARLDVVALSVLPLFLYYWVDDDIAVRACRLINDGIHQYATAYPDRVVGMATVPLQSPKAAAEELERCVRQLGMRSVQIGSNVDGRNLDDPAFLPFFRKVEELGVLIFVHPTVTYVAGAERMSRYYLRNLIGNTVDTAIAVASLIFGGVLDRYPRLKLAFAHGGGAAPYIQGRLQHGYMVRPEAQENIKGSFAEFMGLLYFDTLTHFPAALKYLISVAGPERVVIGTDYPADMGNIRQVELVESIKGLSRADKRRILGDNLAALLGLS